MGPAGRSGHALLAEGTANLGPSEREAAEALRRGWWLLLVWAIASIVADIAVLAFDWTAESLARLRRGLLPRGRGPSARFHLRRTARVGGSASRWASFRRSPASRSSPGLGAPAARTRVLGLVALVEPRFSLAIMVAVLGIWLVLTGLLECVLAFEVRSGGPRVGSPTAPA